MKSKVIASKGRRLRTFHAFGFDPASRKESLNSESAKGVVFH